ncbi:2OG-Fe(II) oxygenase [Dactylosporangium sp. CA-152071]|uniref:2OG-Fe(II) oxygenase n=1 Tax=Dactylosporangium sp. CA-152071 TaxID=3239933 RepID=UPI003D924361
MTAELEVQSSAPDFASNLYAANGSVWVSSGRVRRLTVSGWLGPVSDQLAERYGVPVDVDPAPELPPPPLIGAGSILCRNVLPDVLIARLLALPRPTGSLVERYPGFQPPRLAAEPPWEDWGGIISNALVGAGEVLGAPINYCGEFGVVEYLPGDRFPEHTDHIDAGADTWDRTVSFSLLLNEPDRDFRGGEFEIGGQDMDLHRGDLIAFTSRTPHAVRQITAGRRLVLVAFGEYRR